jgi:hypothetical protein
MLMLLVALLALNAVLHLALVARFGVKTNEPFLIFGVIYAALAVIVWLGVSYALWITLILSVIGLVGLTVTFGKPQRDKTMDRAIWGVDAAGIVVTAILLFTP